MTTEQIFNYLIVTLNKTSSCNHLQIQDKNIKFHEKIDETEEKKINNIILSEISDMKKLIQFLFMLFNITLLFHCFS